MIFKHYRNLYKPVQPTVQGSFSGVSYNEIPTTGKIENFVYCFWELKTDQPLTNPFVYRVVADGCIDIFFEKESPKESFIMGFCRKYTEFELGKNFNYIGIRFFPSVFPLFFGINAKKLSNISQELKLILPGLSHWITENIPENYLFEKTAVEMQFFFESLSVRLQNTYDERFLKALELIYEKKGLLNIESDIDTGVSPRQLRRIFNYYIGTTPKVFSNVVRFQNILNEIENKNFDDFRTYYDLGFFDQAHFIKDFKKFYGVTPSRAFQ